MNQSFSKIWVVVAVGILVIAGVFCWQYFAMQEETRIPGDETTEIDKIITGLKDPMKSNRRKAFEVKVVSDLRQFRTSMKLYYDYHDNKYIQSSTFPKSLDQVMKKTPKPPHEDYAYIWIDNTGEGGDQHFCAYAKLKFHSPDIWIVASEKGDGRVTREPTGLGDACW